MISNLQLFKQLTFLLIFYFSFTLTACGSMHLNTVDDFQIIKEKTFKISPGKNLIVDLSSGDVTVTYWDKDEAHIKVLGNENAFKKMEFRLSGNDDKIELSGRKKSSTSSWFSDLNVKVEIKVPSQFNLDINTAGGDIKCGGINGTARLNTSGGDVWADKFSGDLQVSTSGGDIFLYCKDSEIEAETSGGDIKLEYSGENRGIELSSSGGDIDILLPEKFNASLDLKTSGGDVSCSINMNNIKKSYETSLVGDINGGGKILNARTSGGDITVNEL